jgi:hypothetical protein
MWKMVSNFEGRTLIVGVLKRSSQDNIVSVLKHDEVFTQAI